MMWAFEQVCAMVRVCKVSLLCRRLCIRSSVSTATPPRNRHPSPLFLLSCAANFTTRVQKLKQPQEFFNVSVNIRMTAVRLEGGGLWVRLFKNGGGVDGVGVLGGSETVCLPNAQKSFAVGGGGRGRWLAVLQCVAVWRDGWRWLSSILPSLLLVVVAAVVVCSLFPFPLSWLSSYLPSSSSLLVLLLLVVVVVISLWNRRCCTIFATQA